MRAGVTTPQIADEETVRQALKLPPMSDEARKAWQDDGGVRKPITLAKSEESAIATPEVITNANAN